MSPRKKDEKKYTKYVGIFLAVIMVGSIGMFFFSGGSTNNNNEQTSENVQAAGFESVPGKHVSISFNSIHDGLEATPENVTNAMYIDFASTKGTPLQYLASNIYVKMYTNANISMYNNFYKSNVTKMYIAGYRNSSRIEMHDINPQIVAFPYYMAPETYKGYQPLLLNQGTYRAIIGKPIILGDQQSVEDTIDVIEGDTNSSQNFKQILRFANEKAPIQQIIDVDDESADEYYIEWSIDGYNTFKRTSIYGSPAESTMTKLTERASNASQRGLEYNITSYGNITKVDITTNSSNLGALLEEPSR
ncbi:hypothetical protein [Methanohalophilus mahii]|uniref:Uncharacterized protein n=1 Tax=Methanohalophilus mahii (strain ATCC 35705 / DSM 5219 / SLP) TaxID=547558 RepID=D5EB39_METMS|nr:hypothetical protein [Methanohalophilus mahii]ADE36390.1 hypothetical protein Mmah_0867 [Methanohalophilus mahii DSM 5219]